MKTTSYFRPSLYVPATARYLLVAAALPVIPSSWLYAWGTAPSPSVLNPLYTIALGAWLALVARVVVAQGKVRHPKWMWWAGAAVGVIAWYVHWAAWIAMHRHLQPALQIDASTISMAAYLCLHPDLMLVAATEIAGGTSSVPTSAAMVVVWLVELCAWILPPAMAGAKRAGAPFCEQTATWAREVHVPVRFNYIHNPEAVRLRLEHDPRELFSILVPCSDEAQQFADVIIHRCRGNESFVTVCNFKTIAPEQVPILEDRNRNAAMPDKVECFGQVDGPVVELLRFPIADLDALLRQWEDLASSALADTDGTVQAEPGGAF